MVDFDPGPGVYNLTSAGPYNIFVAKYSSDGALIWAKAMGGTSQDSGCAIAVGPDGSVYTTGGFSGTADFDPGSGTANLTSAGNTDIFISKLDPSGNYVWARAIGGRYYDDGFGIAVGPDGSICIMGRFMDTADFDPGSGTCNLTSAGKYDIFVSKLDASGNYVWAKSMGGTGDDVGCSIVRGAGRECLHHGLFLWHGGFQSRKRHGECHKCRRV